LFDLFMAPFSQELEPPQNPGRFTDARIFGCHRQDDGLTLRATFRSYEPSQRQ
jgi:hypothetical protein